MKCGSRLIFASTGGALYGEVADGQMAGEERPAQPLSPYACSKSSFELYLRAFQKSVGLKHTILRYANVYGPRQDPHGEAGVVAVFCNRIVAGDPLTVFGDGEQTRDYVFVGDVAAANLLLTEVPLPDPGSIDDVAWNVATGTETTVNRLAELLLGSTGRQLEIRHAPARSGELLRSCLRIDKLRGLGWEPGMPLRDGLLRTYEHIAAHT